MKKYLKLALILLVCTIGLVIHYDVAYSDADTTAPVVTKATFTTTSVDKGSNILLNLDVVEEDTGIAQLDAILYCHKNGNITPLHLYADKDYTGEDTSSMYTGTISLEFPVSDSDAAGNYYLGYVKITDNAGNTSTYFNHYNPDGYSVDSDQKSYLKLYGSDDLMKGCLITNGACATVKSNGDDTAPIITDIKFKSTKVAKNENIVAEFTVIEESKISNVEVIYEGYKNNTQYIMIGQMNTWSSSGNKVTATTTLYDSNTAGSYFISRIKITDTAGNMRIYAYDAENKSYYFDDGNAYLIDEGNGNFNAYIKDNAMVTVKSNGDDVAPIINNITLHKDTITKPGVLPITLELKEPDEVMDVVIIIHKNNATEQENYDHMVSFETKSKHSTINFNFPIKTSMNSDEYYIESITIKDYSGNERTYSVSDETGDFFIVDGKQHLADRFDLSYKAGFTTTGYFNVKDEFDVAFEVSLSNKNLLTKIDEMSEGHAGKIFIDGNGIAPKALFDAIKGTNKTLIFYNNNYQWIFNGLTINNTKDIQLKITFSMVDGTDYNVTGNLLKIDFASNGELPGAANIRIKSDYTFEIFKMTEAMYLYYLNPNIDALTYESGSDIVYVLDGSDHWCQFDITHNSTYMVSGKKFITAKKLSLKAPSKKLAAGKKFKLALTFSPSNITSKKVKWSVSNKKYASISSKGVLTAKKAGKGKKVTVTAKAKDGSGKKATITITIMPDSVKSVRIKAPKTTVKAGKSIKLSASIKTTGKKANKALKWTSSNTKYATVNSKGKVVTKKAGKGKIVKITVAATDGSGKKSTVTIKIK